MAENWTELGTIAPYFNEWKVYDVPLVGGEVFRVRHTNWIYPKWGFVWLAFRWDIGSDSGKFGFKKIYPQPDNEVIICPIPKQLQDISVVVRYAIIKLDKRAMWTDPTWAVSLDALNYEAPPASTTDNNDVSGSIG